jgi:pyruvate/2-oxoglutarate dehydrogenase complex dihydrolipoamide acyltransferase (E2) component
MLRLYCLLGIVHGRRVKMTRLRMRVAERLKGAQNTYAMLTTFNEVDMTSLIEMRNSYKVQEQLNRFFSEQLTTS